MSGRDRAAETPQRYPIEKAGRNKLHLILYP